MLRRHSSDNLRVTILLHRLQVFAQQQHINRLLPNHSSIPVRSSYIPAQFKVRGNMAQSLQYSI